jgi:hypothetical protein
MSAAGLKPLPNIRKRFCEGTHILVRKCISDSGSASPLALGSYGEAEEEEEVHGPTVRR